MTGFFNFIKKQDQSASDKIQSTSSQADVVQKSVSYSGIGPTPGGGQPYSGIGRPPGGGTPYSGIGQPPQSVQFSQAGSPSVTQKVGDANSQLNGANSQQQTQTPTQIESDEKKSGQPPSSSTKAATDQQKKDLDLLTHLTHRSNRVFFVAQTKAKELKVPYIDSEHLLHGLLADVEIYNLLVELKIQPQLIEDELNKLYQKGNSMQPPQLSPRLKRILDGSLTTARRLGFEFIAPEHLLLSLYEEGEGIGARVLSKFGLKKEDLNKKVVGKKEGLSAGGKEAEKKKHVLDEFTIDLTAKAAAGQLDPVVERSDVIERVIHILSRRTKNNPALIGEAGVGKTAIVEGLAQKIVAKQVPESLLDKKILQLDLMGILAGASHRGEFEERMKNLIEEIKNQQGKVVLFIDEIHNIVGAGSSGEGSLDVSNFLKPALARGELQLIGATTTTEYRRYIEKDPALERRFQPVLVPEPTEEQAIKMLKATRDKYEAFHRVKIPDDAIEAAVKFSKRYVGDRFLPDKAVDLIDEAASAVRLPLISLPEEIRSLDERVAQLTQELVEAEKKQDKVKGRILRSKIDDLSTLLKEKKDEYNTKKAQTTTAVTIEIIKDIVSRWTGIPVNKITASETERLANLEKILHERLIDQEEAVKVVAEAVRRGRAGLKSQNRPIGSFVFLGPTGVGKTELAKTLAEVLFGQEEAMIRFDMTEYMEKHEVAKLLGAPPGYVGYEEGGKLTEAVRRRPYSVVLFDEVEKAHPDIFNILLQILDDGRLTDNKGRTISFKNTVVICTSNLGSKLIQEELLRSGKTEVEEPPVISSYTISPTGRQVLTIGNKYFEKGKGKKEWSEGVLLDYFAGQKIETTEDKDKQNFPIHGFDTHSIAFDGEEVITKGSDVYYRPSTTAKVWQKVNLVDLFNDHIVVNALPDAPEEQLPTAKLKTHSFSPDGWELISYQNRLWKRRKGETKWETLMLEDYFKDHQVANGKNLPINYWDIHTFSPDNQEIIIVGQDLYLRKVNEALWQKYSLKEYFGEDFPLEKEMEEKQKIEVELGKKRYGLLKEKLMNEILKFFRPELVNRFDEVVIFEPLQYIHMTKIVELQLKSVAKLLEEQEIGFSWSEAAIKEIVRAGFDPIFGARPLKRAIQKMIENPLSELIISGKLKAGDQVMVDFDGINLIFNIDKLELINEEVTKQKFVCKECGHQFETEVVKNATVICPKCASVKVELITEKIDNQVKESKEKTKQQEEKEVAKATESKKGTGNGIKKESVTEDKSEQSISAAVIN
jgi:ATP-dependent Clp protease ATP-binding subunit ClpC